MASSVPNWVVPKSRWFGKYGSSIVWRASWARNGFLVIGPHWLGVVATYLVIAAGTWMNLRILSKKTTSLEPGTYLLVTRFIYIFAGLTAFLLTVTAFGNPGIVFKQNNEDRGGSEEEWELKRIPYCKICKVPTPAHLNIGHCYTCNYCIEGLDHHCPWMGQCIGKKNKLVFVLFNISWVLYFAEYLLLATVGGFDESVSPPKNS